MGVYISLQKGIEDFWDLKIPNKNIPNIREFSGFSPRVLRDIFGKIL
jgi:hypothetical protein